MAHDVYGLENCVDMASKKEYLFITSMCLCYHYKKMHWLLLRTFFAPCITITGSSLLNKIENGILSKMT